MDKILIDRLGHKGDGIAGSGADIRMVPYTLPGETVAVAPNGDLKEVLAASEHRVEPSCMHFGRCGGCLLQHASDDFLADWKVSVVKTALQAHGLETSFRPIQTSPPRSRRRAVFAGRRTKKTTQVGFYSRRSTEIVPISHCDLVVPELLAALPLLQELTRVGASRSSNVRLAVTSFENGLDIAVSDAKPLDIKMKAELGALAEKHDLARLSWQGEPVAMRMPPMQRFGNCVVSPPVDAFLQATAQGEEALVAAVRDAVGTSGRIVDLFAGCGTFALALAGQAEIHAVESEQEMLAALDAGWRAASDLKRVTTERRDLIKRTLLPAEFKKFDAAIIDPPRAGAEAQIIEIAASQIPVIAAVSCNPVSFARDAAVLVAAGFNLEWVQVVDQFRWSPHVELAARFSR